MEFLTRQDIFLIAVYLVGALAGGGFGYYIGRIRGIKQSVDVTLAMLIENGFVKTKTNADGETGLVKIKED